jgi:hypothetical protein
MFGSRINMPRRSIGFAITMIIPPVKSEEKGNFDIKSLPIALYIGRFASELCCVK